MQEKDNLLTICPCGKGTNCYNSEISDFKQCFDCGLTKIPSGTDVENYPKLFKDLSIGDWYPFYINNDNFTVFVDGTCKEDSKYVYVEKSEDGKTKHETRKEFEINDFFNLLKFLNDGAI